MSLAEPEEFADDLPLSEEELAREIAAYCAWHLAEHAEEKDPSALFELIEHAYLADQVSTLGNYAAASRTLERFALPHARGERFLLYAATALALQKLAARLDDEPTARAILQVGRHDLVAGLADQLALPLERARVWALLAAAHRDAAAGATYCRQAIDTVDSFFDSTGSSPSSEDQACLLLVLGELAPETAGAWIRWQKSPLLDASLREKLRLQLVEGLWRRGGWRADSLLSEVLRCAEPEALAGLLRRLVAGLEVSQVAECAAFFAAWRREDPLAAWRAVLQAGAAIRAEEVLFSWWGALTRELLPPLELLGAAALPLLRRLRDFDLERLGALPAPALGRAMLALAWVYRAPGQTLGAARAAIEAVALPSARFFAVLHLALAAAPCDLGLARGWLRSAGEALEAARYRADLELLALYLEATAELEPKALRRELQEVAFAPGFSPEDLLGLADLIADARVWQPFLDAVEKFALAAAENELAAFELRSRVLDRLGSRLLYLEGGLDRFGRLAARQLLEEEERLRLELATRLAADGRQTEARLLIGGMPEGAGRRLGEIRLLASAQQKELDGAALFAALRDLSSLEDELWGLRALLEAPVDIEESCERVLGRIADPDTRSLFVLHLVQHRAAFEQRHFGKLRDPRSLLETARPLLVIEDERRLAALVPELVRTGLLAGPKFALAELLESAEGLLRLQKLPPEELLEAYEQLATIAGRDDRLSAPFFAALTRLPKIFEEPERIRIFRPLIPRAVALLEGASGPRAAAAWLGKLGQGWLIGEPPWPAIIGFCRAGRNTREKEAAAWPPAALAPEILDAGVVLLAADHPELALELIGRLPAGASRQRLAYRLLRLGWLDPARHPQTLFFLDDEALQRTTLIRRHLEGPDREFLTNLADAAAYGQIDTRHPDDLPILRRLWRCQPELAGEPLGRAVRQALARGPEAAEKALRLWLHASLAPCLGQEQREKLATWQNLRAALDRSRHLDHRPAELD